MQGGTAEEMLAHQLNVIAHRIDDHCLQLTEIWLCHDQS
jgi:hypothetical protein